MTERERQIIELIKKNPLVSQKELANSLNITRSSVAVHITNLQRKGYIAGKGYIVKEGEYVCIIGGTNVDIQGFPKENFVIRDSNPGSVKISFGGVGRNIGENLVKLGIETKLISVIGDDPYGKRILTEALKTGLDMSESLTLKGKSTSTYLSLLDEKGDMLGAISDMDIFNELTVQYLQEKNHLLQHAALCIVDTNIPTETIEYALTHHKDKVFFLDTVSTSKAVRIKDLIGKFHTIKPNRVEAEILAGIKINNEADIKRAGEYFLKKGVRRAFITLGEGGVYYTNGIEDGIINASKREVVNATGAGDAFMAALIYSYLNKFHIKKSTIFAMAAAQVALSHENTINPNMSIDNINREMEDIDLC
ncbi:PfkB family carbohydrate kinase [Alkaliphilus peptidifermentans]|uniref:Pseudouridine kinase n=1 Tax=Alkaliphilus peptidifermentans DSM 18978 TaxID=1120976 RepID=A0A1G5BEG6_9FIRM|nr:PfkB family carbohydrate kinase [Alkaliphilus peptidifermentans]SCX88501.1 pseudouridine kinase [Alkaliphilus peptidifermentans DSM 18978]